MRIGNGVRYTLQYLVAGHIQNNELSAQELTRRKSRWSTSNGCSVDLTRLTVIADICRWLLVE